MMLVLLGKSIKNVFTTDNNARKIRVLQTKPPGICFSGGFVIYIMRGMISTMYGVISTKYGVISIRRVAGL